MLIIQTIFIWYIVKIFLTHLSHAHDCTRKRRISADKRLLSDSARFGARLAPVKKARPAFYGILFSISGTPSSLYIYIKFYILREGRVPETLTNIPKEGVLGGMDGFPCLGGI